MSLSKGGSESQSSWYELLPEKDEFRESLGLFGVVALRVGVSTSTSSGHDELRREVASCSGARELSPGTWMVSESPGFAGPAVVLVSRAMVTLQLIGVGT